MKQSTTTENPDNRRPPNVILIMTDQMRADHLGCYGQTRINTPHIDALAQHGTRFDRCYVASPVCMPNRASIFTGRRPSVHRVRMNGIPLSLQENTFVELLRLRGYRTALIGKSHLQNMYEMPPMVNPPKPAAGLWMPPASASEAVRCHPGDDYGQELASRWNKDRPLQVQTPFYGFEHVQFCTEHGDLVGGHYRHWLQGQGYDPATLSGPQNSLAHTYSCPQAWRTRMPEELYPTRYIENESIHYLKEHAARHRNQPFFLTISFPDPHHPFTPPGRYWDMYKPEDQVVPESFHCPDDVLPQVQWARNERRKKRPSDQSFGAFNVLEHEAKEAIALTFGMITMIDDAIGNVLATLRETGQTDDTVIIFTSDHGDFLGDHSLLLKGPLHLQGLLRVPLIWHDPQARANQRQSPYLCSSIDISATILERCGIHPYNGLQGRSLIPDIDANQTPTPPSSVLIEDDAQAPHLGFSVAPRIRTLITTRYRLSIYGRTGHCELFDLLEVPNELANQWHNPDFSDIKSRLIEELAMAEMDAADLSPWPRFAA